MKRTFNFLIILAFVLVSSASFGQKIGYINSQELLSIMPERDSVYNSLQKEVTAMENQLETMSNEYQNKLATYLEQRDTLTRFVREDRETELQDLQIRIENYQSTAQERIQQLEMELTAPMLEKAQKAIDDVAKEKEFDIIFDTSIGSILYISDSMTNILPLVKEKMGITE